MIDTPLIVNGKDVFLLGTAHISQQSVDDAVALIERVRPEVVCIELCDNRYQSLKDPDSWKKTDIVKVIHEGKSQLLLAQLILASYQKKLGEDLKIKPGQEMITASLEAERVGAQVHLIDRDVKITLKRTWGALGLKSVCKLLWSAVESLWRPIKVTAEEIERLKTSDALAEAMAEFSSALPEVRDTLIDERDRYMAEKIRTAPGNRIVAIVGAGHVPGIQKYLNTPQDLDSLMTLPKSSLIGNVLTYGIPAILIGAIVIGVYESGLQAGASILERWALITGGCAMIGAVLSLSHPLTILATFLSAPIATLHPLIATGWVAGLVEAWVRKPTVADFESVIDDMGSMKGIYRNRVSRILLIVVLVNLTASAGTLLGISKIAF